MSEGTEITWFNIVKLQQLCKAKIEAHSLYDPTSEYVYRRFLWYEMGNKTTHLSKISQKLRMQDCTAAARNILGLSRINRDHLGHPLINAHQFRTDGVKFCNLSRVDNGGSQLWYKECPTESGRMSNYS